MRKGSNQIPPLLLVFSEDFCYAVKITKLERYARFELTRGRRGNF